MSDWFSTTSLASGRGGALGAERQDQFEDGEVLDAVGGRRQPIEDGVGPPPGAHVASAPARLRRILRRPAQQPGDRRRVAHLDDAFQQRHEVLAERAVPGDVRPHEGRVALVAALIAADEPAVVGGVRLDHPEPRMVRGDVLVGVRAPLLVGAADEVDAQPGQDVRRIVQRLRQILEAAPDQHVERSRIGGPRRARRSSATPRSSGGRRHTAPLRSRPASSSRGAPPASDSDPSDCAGSGSPARNGRSPRGCGWRAPARTATRPGLPGRTRRRRAAGGPSTADRRDPFRRCRSRPGRDGARRRAHPGGPVPARSRGRTPAHTPRQR